MTKRISILTLTIFFFAATTALPVSVHLCKMMGDVDVSECAMNHHAACNNNNDDGLQLKRVVDPCCQISLVDNKINDEYVGAKIDQNTFSVVKIIDIGYNTFLKLAFSDKVDGYSTDSSPPIFDNHIYLPLSVLII